MTTSLALSVVFAALIAVIFFGIALMLLIRLLALSILIIIMPLVWLAWIIPDLKKYWDQWWRTFLRWNFFLPAVTFFLYLGILTAGSTDIFVKTTTIGNEPALEVSNNIMQASGAGGLIALIIKIGIFAAALWVSNSMGIAGSAGAYGAAVNIKNRLIGGVTGGAKAIGRLPLKAGSELGTRPAKATARGMARLLNNRIVPLRWFPGAKGVITKLSEAGARKGEVEDYQKKYLASLTPKDFKNVQKTSPIGPIAKAALLTESIKRGELKGLTENIKDPDEKKVRLQEFVAAAKAMNPRTEPKDISTIKEILGTNPHLAPDLLPNQKDEKTGSPLTRRQVIARQVKRIKSEKIIDVSTDALKDLDFVLELSPGQIGTLYSRGSGAQLDEIRKIIEDKLSSPLKDLSKKIKETQEEILKAKERDPSAITSLRADLKKHYSDTEAELVKPGMEMQKEIFNQLRIMNQRIIHPSSTNPLP